MKVGEYVRTPKGIGRINQMYSDRKDSYIYLDCGITIDYITKDFTEEEINKMYPSSPNIIDLIEEGDYVNGYLIIEKDINNELRYIDLRDRNMKYVKYLDIKSIVTREQFNCMEYKVGDINE